MEPVVIFCAIWVLCGVASHGISLAHLQKEFVLIARQRRWSQFLFCSTFSFVFGPLALFAVLVVYRPYRGFMFLPFSDEQWLSTALEQYPLYEPFFRREIKGLEA